jgi:carbamoyl-phosphate synthase large subunit
MKKKILITGAHGDIALSIYRIIKEKYKEKYSIDGMDVLPDGPGDFVFNKVYKSPNPTTKKYNIFFKGIANQYRLIIPTTEGELKYFSKKKNLYLIKNFPILINKKSIIKIFLNKISTQYFLEKNNIYPTKFSLPLNKIKNYTKPFFLKKIFGSGNRNYQIINSKQKFNKLSKLKKNEWMAQEYFNYKYDEYTCALIKIEKFISTIILKRKLNGGLTYYAELIKNNEIQNTIESIARKIDLTGCINIQLKIYKNRIAIFEINPRISSSVMIRHKLGFTDCLWWVEYFLNKKIPTPKKIINKSVYKFYTEKFIN